jgi:hypothetical protein
VCGGKDSLFVCLQVFFEGKSKNTRTRNGA